MEIRIAKPYGYCFGVQRALDMVEKALAEGPFPVRTLGPIIHNPTAIKELTEKGVAPVSLPEEASSGTLIQRSHGTTKEEAARIPTGVRVLDATCPFVRRAQNKAREYSESGLTVLLVGDKNHPETKAIMSYAGGGALCVKDVSELTEVLARLKNSEVALLAQTTARPDQVEKILAELKKAGISVQCSNTICTATHERQHATLVLSGECDVILVVGGRTSANTRQLLEIANETGTPAHLVESGADVSPEWFVGKSRVGIAAGASTPDRVIKEVVGKVEELEKPGREAQTEEARADEPETLPEEPEKTPCETPISFEVPAEEETLPPESESQEQPVEPPSDSIPAEEPETAATPSEEEQEPQEAPEGAEVSQEDLYDESFKSLAEGQIVKGRVVSVDENGALVDVGAKSEGLIPASELQRKGVFATTPLSPGDEIMVYVQSSDPGDGTIRLSKRRADEEAAWDKAEAAHAEGEALEAPVVQEVKGGLVVDIGLRGFVPASQVERGYVNDLSRYVGKALKLKVLELDRQKNRVVLSQRVVLEEEHERLCAETWGNIEEGQVRGGTVKGITDFGVFVDLGGVDGLLHISELSWGRVKHPSEVLREGDQIDCKVLRVDKEKGKISLGRKQVLPDPWETVEAKYPVGVELEGEVTRTAPFGAFVQLEPGVEGLVHISEVSNRHITKPEEAVSAGDKVQVKVLRVRQDERRISLSIRQAVQAGESMSEVEAEEQPERDAEPPNDQVELELCPVEEAPETQEPAAPGEPEEPEGSEELPEPEFE